MARSHILGRRAEDLAAELLRSQGWCVLERNWRFHHKEIDLVASREDVVAFVEVKARSGDAFGHPLEAVTARKRHDLATAARAWIARHGRPGQTYRFDVVWVLGNSRGQQVRRVEDAWRV